MTDHVLHSFVLDNQMGDSDDVHQLGVTKASHCAQSSEAFLGLSTPSYEEAPLFFVAGGYYNPLNWTKCSCILGLMQGALFCSLPDVSWVSSP